MSIVHVQTSKPYDVFVKEGSLEFCGKLISEKVSLCKAALISDTTVYALYGEKVLRSLEKSGFDVVHYEYIPGEENKNFSTVASMAEFLAENEFTRSDVIVALGGGITGDLAGFCAASYLRGIRFVQVPTTLLAMVDSSVGGKTGCNLNAGKNLMGAFWQPELVICDAQALKTLDEVNIACGKAEAIKTGMLGSPVLFEAFETFSEDRFSSIIEQCVQIKAKVVSEDERESGCRKLLNFGHTIGHAVEKLSNYKVPHGHAVAVGMYAAAKGTESLRLGTEPCLERLASVLKRHSLPCSMPYGVEELYKVICVDKKRKGNNITFVLPDKIGTCVLKDFTMEQAKEFIKACVQI